MQGDGGRHRRQRAEDERQVLAVRAGDGDAFATLVRRWSDRCWEVAWRILHDRELAADVAQDAMLTAWQQLDRLGDPAAFGGWVLRISRNRALDRLERERRTVLTEDDATLEPVGAATVAQAVGDPVAEFEQGRRRDLVWAASAALGERDASVLDLLLRHGLEPHELAEVLEVSPNAVHQKLFRLRARLGVAIRAWLVWRDGEPDCVVLRAELTAAGIIEFGSALVRAVEQHAGACDVCAERRERVVAPAAMFSAVPLLAMPAVARAHVATQLAAAGVPVPADEAWARGDDATTADGSAGPDAKPGDGSGGHGTPGSSGVETGGSSRGGAASVRRTRVWERVAAVLAWVFVATVLLPVLGGGEPAVEVLDRVHAGPLPADEPGQRETPQTSPSDDDAGSADDGVDSFGDDGDSGVMPDDQPTDGEESPPSGPTEHGPGSGPSPQAESSGPGAEDGPTGRPGPSGTNGSGEPAPPHRRPGNDPDDPGPSTPPGREEPEPDDAEPPVEPPEIHDLLVRTSSSACGPRPGPVLHDLRWSSTGGETATLEVNGRSLGEFPVTGSREVCDRGTSTFRLEVTGEGGTAVVVWPHHRPERTGPVPPS